MGNIVGSTRGTAYLGVGAKSPPGTHQFINRDPNQYDNQDYNLFDFGQNTTTKDIFQLVDLQGTSTSAGALATWVKVTSATGDLQTLTGDIGPAVNPLSGNIDVLTGQSVLLSGSTIAFNGTIPNTLTLQVTDENLNTIIGNVAGNLGIVGERNTGYGPSTLALLTTGSHNTALGIAALNSATTASGNTMIGDSAADALTLGISNVGVGFLALSGLTDGSFNIAVGNGAGSALDSNQSSNIYLGSLGDVLDDNTMRLGITGSADGQINRSFVAGTYGVNPAGTNQIVSISSDGQLGSFTLAADSGMALPSTGVLNIVGDGTTAVTSAAGNTITITSLGGGGGGGTSSSIIGVGDETICVTSSDLNISPYTGSNTSASLTFVVPCAGTLRNFYVSVFGNTSTTNTTVTVTKNGSPTALTITLTALTTGIFSDLTHNAVFAAGDTLIFKSTQSTTGNITGTISAEFASSAGGGSVNGLMADDGNIVTDTGGIIQVLGGSGIVTSGTSGPNTLTISATGTSSYTYTNVNTSPYVVLTTDEYLSVDSSGGARILRFPNTPVLGKSFVVKDRTGTAATNNITITTVSGVTLIDGAATFVMNTAYESVNIIGNGTTYEIF